jgi:hypothetical protein
MNTQLQHGLELALLNPLPAEVQVGSVVVLNDVVRAEVVEVAVVHGVRVGVVSVLNGSVSDLVAVLKAGRVVVVVDDVVKQVVNVRVVKDAALVAAVGRPNVKVVAVLEVVDVVPDVVERVNLNKEGSSSEVPSPA